ncbi:DUF3238 domain-containing protein [Paenibacillus sp. GCM10012307]|uniref:DUF3238 domain-containing protein n=1 Tax=Paenibacillus roseus TaxID=2798579 RepID=A0A934JCL4_9BACL|nr:DUF3238 domain-containing protein [Paenibacillus roseus]MBJ6364340.1 DUF3238 domain-containing protein [Paenibacillus roseus]
MKRLYMICLSLFLLLGVFNFSSVEAREKDILEIVSIESQSNSIRIEWKKAPYEFEVIEDNKVVYSGTAHYFVDENLDSDNVYTYLVRVLDLDGNIQDQAKIKTRTKSEATVISRQGNEDSKVSINDLVVNTIVKKNSIVIDWEDLKSIQSYKVYKNGIFIGESKKSEFKDRTSNTGNESVYEIKFSVDLTKEQKDALREEFEKTGMKITPVEESLIKNEYSIIRLVDQGLSNLEDSEQQAQLFSTSTQKWDIRYTTFIPMDYAENPWSLVDSIKYFSGDNRSFSSTASSFRTRADVSVCFCSAAQSVGLNRYIGETVGYDNNKNEIPGARARASENGITLSSQELSTSKIKFKVTHAVNNPLVASPDIDYNYTGTFFSNGSFTIVGDHDQAPSHELYIKLPGQTTYTTLMQDSHQGFNYLWPFMPSKSINISR